MQYKEIKINMRELDQIHRYEDRYGKYLSIFQDIAETSKEILITVYGAPISWIPLLEYLGCKTEDSIYYFNHDEIVAAACYSTNPKTLKCDRIAVEVLCGFRPETVDALWKCDRQWKTDRVPHEHKSEFIVTSNGSFHRPEVKDYEQALMEYAPTKKKVVLVPCAADKPYPSPLHKRVMEMMPNDYYIMNATGVLGLVPQDLWPIMPHYDSGIPNEWRLYQIAKEYFLRNEHSKIICYVDYYSLALRAAFDSIENRYLWDTQVKFVNEVKFYSDYLDLLDTERLEKLRQAFKEIE